MDTTRRHNWSLGLIFLAIVVVLWVLSSFLINDLFDKDIYPKPFLITYLNTTVFIFYLIPIYTRPSSGHHSTQLNLVETLKLSLQFCILWYLSNLFTNTSLIFTSVSSQTILSSTLSFFTLIIGFVVGVERFHYRKLAGLVLSMLGIVLVNQFDLSGEITLKTMLGNLLALFGALGYGIYSILLKFKVKDESRLNFHLFFGFVGLFNMVILWVPLLVLHLTKVETFEWPHGSYTFKVLLVNAVITFISDYLWAKLMILTSPLTTTVGLSFTIPLLLLGDFILKRQLDFNLIYIIGAALIGGSFIIINHDEERDEELVHIE